MFKNVLEWLERTAETHGSKIAYIEDDETTLSFDQVIDSARRVGTVLGEVVDRTPIAVLGGRKISTIVSFLGVVYSGHAYAPIDGKMPEERIQSIVRVLRPAAILADEENGEIAHKISDFCHREFGIKTKVYNLSDSLENRIDEETLMDIRNNMVMTDPLYVIFTSGSSGKPKGVITSHQSLMCYIDSYSEVMGIDSSDVLGNQSPLDYIAAIRDIYLPLLTGCSSLIIPKAYFMQPQLLFECMNHYRVSSVGWSVSAFSILASLNAFDEIKPDFLTKVCFSGSIMPNRCLALWQDNLPNTRFVNQYGPTEATASCTYYEIDHRIEDNESIPIGRAYRNYRVFLLDEDGQPTLTGNIGEICVSGPILALGYYNDPERTASGFVTNPNCCFYPERMYKTGDYGRIREDGMLEFHGRKDRQIKHLGHRIELDEIEIAANTIIGIDESICLYDNKREMLYFFYSGKAAVRDISIELRSKLPEFMVPRKIRQFDELPKLPNGKIDMNTLKENMK